MIGKLLTRIFLGVEKTDVVECGGAKATITDEDGQVFTITRRGFVQRVFESNWTTSGMELLHKYMSESKRQVLVADSGGMIPVCRIKKIEIDEFQYKDSVTYYA